MNALARIVDSAVRPYGSVHQARPTSGRPAGEAGIGRHANDAVYEVEQDVEYIGVANRGRPLRSMPSSAFFAQHIAQHPERRNASLEQSQADVAYRDALDMGVDLERPTPLSLAV